MKKAYLVNKFGITEVYERLRSNVWVFLKSTSGAEFAARPENVFFQTRG